MGPFYEAHFTAKLSIKPSPGQRIKSQEAHTAPTLDPQVVLTESVNVLKMDTDYMQEQVPGERALRLHPNL